MIGRFIQADTIVPEPGNPQALNRYAYTAGNPLRYIDPSGHWYGPDQYDPAGIENLQEAYGFSKMSGEWGVLFEYMVRNSNPDPMPVVQLREGSPEQHDTGLDGLALTCDLVGYIVDGLSAGLTTGAALVEVMGGIAAVIGGSEIIPPVVIVDSALQNGAHNLDVIGTSTAVIGDLADGYTYIDWGITQSGWPEVVIGEATIVDQLATQAEAVSPLAVADLAVDAAIVRYDLHRLGNGTPIMKYRVTVAGGGFVLYANSD